MFFTLNTSFCKKIWFFEKHVITPEKRYEKSVKTPQNDVKHAYTHPKSCFLKTWKTIFTLCTRHKKHKKVFKNIFFIILQFFYTFWRFYTVGKCFSFELFMFFTKFKWNCSAVFTVYGTKKCDFTPGKPRRGVQILAPKWNP